MEAELREQIRRSGVHYSVEYLGCIPIESSIREMTTDLRKMVVRECSYMLAMEHGLVDAQHERELNSVAKKVIGSGKMLVKKREDGKLVEAELNIQAKQVRLVDGAVIIAKHLVTNVSFAATEDFGGLFGYVGKKADGSDRRCYVMRCPDNILVMNALRVAMDLYREKLEQEMSPGGHPPASPQTHNNPPPVRNIQDHSNFKTPIPPVIPVSPSESYRDEPYRRGQFRPVNANRQPRSRPIVTPSVSCGDVSRRPSEAPHTPLILHQADRIRDDTEIVTRNVQEMEREPWYHGVLSRGVAEILLQQDGDFLVRQSTNSPGQIILSGREGTPKHILLIDRNKVRTKERDYESVRELINFHLRTGAVITSEESELRLVRPIHRANFQ